MSARDAITRALEDADYLRRSPFSAGGPAGHKEWLHFCVYAPGVDVLANVSFVDDVRPGAPRGAEHARITVLVREEEWDGDVDLYEPEEVIVRGGQVHATLGQNTFELRDGEYHVSVDMRERPISLRLRFTPVTMPSLANNIQLDPGPPINWLVVPRLFARGTVIIDGREHRFVDAPAYHDHNWGRFAWGRDFAWEWGFALPHDRAVPWSLVFVRLLDRAHTRALMQAIFLWKGARQHRVMRAGDVSVRHEGLLSPSRVLKIPRVMSLIAPSTRTDVPRELFVHGAADGDQLLCRFAASDLAEVVIPNDHDLGVTVINEVSGHVTLSGSVRGERVSMEGRAIFEFLGS
jgi:hypothetical protein